MTTFTEAEILVSDLTSLQWALDDLDGVIIVVDRAVGSVAFSVDLSEVKERLRLAIKYDVRPAELLGSRIVVVRAPLAHTAIQQRHPKPASM